MNKFKLENLNFMFHVHGSSYGLAVQLQLFTRREIIVFNDLDEPHGCLQRKNRSLLEAPCMNRFLNIAICMSIWRRRKITVQVYYSLELQAN